MVPGDRFVMDENVFIVIDMQRAETQVDRHFARAVAAGLGG